MQIQPTINVRSAASAPRGKVAAAGGASYAQDGLQLSSYAQQQAAQDVERAFANDRNADGYLSGAEITPDLARYAYRAADGRQILTRQNLLDARTREYQASPQPYAPTPTPQPYNPAPNNGPYAPQPYTPAPNSGPYAPQPYNPAPNNGPSPYAPQPYSPAPNNGPSPYAPYPPAPNNGPSPYAPYTPAPNNGPSPYAPTPYNPLPNNGPYAPNPAPNNGPSPYAPTPYSPAPQPYNPTPQPYSPAPNNGPYAPQPYNPAPTPQPYNPVPQPYNPVPTPQPYNPAPNNGPSPYAPQPYNPTPTPYNPGPAPVVPTPQPTPVSGGFQALGLRAGMTLSLERGTRIHGIKIDGHGSLTNVTANALDADVEAAGPLGLGHKSVSLHCEIGADGTMHVVATDRNGGGALLNETGRVQNGADGSLSITGPKGTTTLRSDGRGGLLVNSPEGSVHLVAG